MIKQSAEPQVSFRYTATLHLTGLRGEPKAPHTGRGDLVQGAHQRLSKLLLGDLLGTTEKPF